MSAPTAFGAFKQRVLAQGLRPSVRARINGQERSAEQLQMQKRSRRVRDIELLAQIDKRIRAADIRQTWHVYERLVRRSEGSSAQSISPLVQARRTVNSAKTNISVVHSRVLRVLHPKYLHGYSGSQMDELGERARRVVENMNKGGLDVSRQDLNGLMNSFVRNNDATDQIWQFATLGGITRDVTNYNCYINAKLYGKQYERAFEVYREMQGAGIAGNTYTSTCLIRLYGATGDLIAARRVFDGVLSELGRGGPNVHVYNAMLDVLGTNGLMEEMRDLFLRMVGLADYSGGDVSGFGKDECRGGLERMGAIAPDRSTFHVLAKWHAQYWDLGTAKKYVELMAGGYGIQPVAKTFKVMVNVKTAMRDFQGCCELGVMMAERYDITPPGHIMRALERAGKVRKDMEDKIRESEEQASSLLSAFVK